jgi:hypothetical protein
VTEDTSPGPAIADVVLPGSQAGSPCMVITVTTPTGPWTVWMSDDDALDDFGGAGVFAAQGTEPGEAAYWAWTSHSRVGARDHGAGCADAWYGGCDCGAEAPLTSQVRSLLLDAGRQLVREHRRRRGERDTARQQSENEEFWRRMADQDSRVLVGGGGDGWRLWDGNPPRGTGAAILPPGPIPAELDPRFCGVVGDAVGLYAIRDPRQREQGQPGG